MNRCCLGDRLYRRATTGGRNLAMIMILLRAMSLFALRRIVPPTMRRIVPPTLRRIVPPTMRRIVHSDSLLRPGQTGKIPVVHGDDLRVLGERLPSECVNARQNDHDHDRHDQGDGDVSMDLLYLHRVVVRCEKNTG